MSVTVYRELVGRTVAEGETQYSHTNTNIFNILSWCFSKNTSAFPSQVLASASGQANSFQKRENGNTCLHSLASDWVNPVWLRAWAQTFRRFMIQLFFPIYNLARSHQLLFLLASSGPLPRPPPSHPTPKLLSLQHPSSHVYPTCPTRTILLLPLTSP